MVGTVAERPGTDWECAFFVDVLERLDNIGDGECFSAIPIEEAVLCW